MELFPEALDVLAELFSEDLPSVREVESLMVSQVICRMSVVVVKSNAK